MKHLTKRLVCVALALIMAVGMSVGVFAADDSASALVSPQSLYVNGERVNCEKYNIGEYNFFKLRDLAALLSGTKYQFDLTYDPATVTANLITGKAYTPEGGELDVGADNSASCVKSAWTLYVDGEKVSAECYNLGGNNYFKLRDVAAVLGFGATYNAVSNAAVVTAMEDVLFIHVNDGKTKITDSYFDEYFKGGNAAEGVAALLNAGKVSVNYLPLPAAETDTTQYNVNKVKALWKGDAGWGYSVHKTTTDANLTFDAARLGFIETVSTVCGHTTTLALGEDGYVSGINIMNVESVMVTDISYFNESTHIKRGDFELETNRGVRPDVNNEVFNTAYFDMDIAIGDFATYYYGPNGWVIDRAEQVKGTIEHATGLAGGAGYKINVTDARRESNVSRYNLRSYNRPTQFWNAYSALGLTDVTVNVWCTSTGHPIGFTYGDAGKAALKQAIEFCNAAKEAVVVSEDGEDVAVGKMWVAQADMDTFTAAIAAADKVAKNNATAIYDWDQAIYTLYEAYGQGGSKPSGFVGAQGGGTGAAEETPTGELRVEGLKGSVYTSINDGSTKITDAKYDKYFKDGAAAGVAALLNAGKVCVNGIAVPATDAETDAYNINMVKALFKGEAGWGYSVHKTTTDTNMTFEAARLGLVETVSTVCGHYVEITLGADGYATMINMNNVETAYVTDITSHGTTTEIKRGEFQLETNRGVRPDVDTLAFPLNESIAIGDFIVFWYGVDGWVAERANTVTGTIERGTGIAGGTGYIIGGTDARRESNVSRYNLREYNRPTQFWTEYSALGLTSAEVTVWTTNTGHPIGFSYGANGKAAMKLAVENCKAAMAAVVVSAKDGEDVAVGTKWVTQEVMDEFKAAVDVAEKYSKSNAVGVAQWDQYIYELGLALGQGGAKPSGFIGNQGEGTMA